ncbi:hypothetical protein ASNO1_77600 [Corallococcus caeni]|uniref:Uncharacterized protein n=1 Tax=Corallococcus caeni TaxID=3082388 RepID=A0ABQ6R5V6_9BACT|nr:hypothetical protein ASNO1_77600 [Corallococcus sp. NO1]
MRLHLVRLRQPLPDGSHRRVRRRELLPQVPQPPDINLLHDDRALLARHLHREHSATAGPQRRVRRLHRRLQVLGVVVAATKDDEVLAPPGDVQLAIRPQEAQVTRAQIRPAVLPGDARLERLARRVLTAPVALGDARPRHPDLAHLAGRAPLQRLRIHDGDALLRQRPATPHQRPRPRLRRAHFLSAVPLQRSA